MEQLRQVGSLSGKNVIYNLGKIDLSEFDRFYTNVSGDETSFASTSQQQQQQQNGSSVGFDGSGGVDEIDPYDPNLFKDEIIDIDFGAIDAYTAGLNAQINAEKANSSRSGDGQLQFPSHILTSNHATFLDNQMLLGDAFFNQSTSANNNAQQPNESTSNLNGNINQNGVMMIFCRCCCSSLNV